jgi:hypothetical protein
LNHRTGPITHTQTRAARMAMSAAFSSSICASCPTF